MSANCGHLQPERALSLNPPPRSERAARGEGLVIVLLPHRFGPNADLAHVDWVETQSKGGGFRAQPEVKLGRGNKEWVGNNRVQIVPALAPLI